MKDIVVYIHGKNGSAAEAARYRRLFADSDVLGFDYEARTPWEAKEEFAPYFKSILKSRKSVTIVANSIGAFFAMHALQDMRIKKVYFISPIVNMENLILNMLSQANASEQELRDKGELSTKFGKNFHGDIFATSENILSTGLRRRIFYTVKTTI